MGSSPTRRTTTPVGIPVRIAPCVSWSPDSGTGRHRHPEWTPDEPWPQEVSSYAIDDGVRLLLFDPLAVPDGLLELATEREPVIVLTAPVARARRPAARRAPRRAGCIAPPPDTAADLVQKFGITSRAGGRRQPRPRPGSSRGRGRTRVAAGDRLPLGIERVPRTGAQRPHALGRGSPGTGLRRHARRLRWRLRDERVAARRRDARRGRGAPATAPRPVRSSSCSLRTAHRPTAPHSSARWPDGARRARAATARPRNRRPCRRVWRPMLDSPRLTSASIAVRRDPPTVEDLRSTTVPDDPVQRRDLILIERARSGDLDAFNDLVTLYQDALFALVVRMVPDRDQASDAVQEAFFSAYRNLGSFRGGSVKSWLNRICVNAAMDTQRARKRRPVQPYPELEDESWQPRAGDEADPERIAVQAERSRALAAASGAHHRRSADGDRAVRRRGLRLRRDRRDDRRLARDGQVADPSRPARAARPARSIGWSCSVADARRMPATTGSRSPLRSAAA